MKQRYEPSPYFSIMCRNIGIGGKIEFKAVLAIAPAQNHVQWLKLWALGRYLEKMEGAAPNQSAVVCFKHSGGRRRQLE